jgi:hypothetical protein
MKNSQKTMKTIGFLMFLMIFNDFALWNDDNTYSGVLSRQLMPGGEVLRRFFGANSPA